ncbi:MAG TPA: WD40 repeat domain-containing serine/threonine protein kinase [Gemmataceae bacterium]|nr:WD40 repeat domain-containing serine/threonine protein kinase [Gemmataceae bacterium]
MTDESVFTAALALPESDRAAYLDRACAGNPSLRADIQALLAAHAASHFLDRPPADVAATGAFRPTAAAVGDRVGPYKLLQQLGEGGMGTVYMAEQEEPVRRMVAVKIIRAGADSRSVLARFEAERQALALMDHPNIARVFDAGTTPGGAPYFVMELVKGVPITTFCDESHLPLRARLELFVPVCQALQHAHQKGVIHRDIKPSNVLVALYDDRPVPKVIDFGVAKATSQRLTDKTLFTAYGAVVGTPEYMSPEQAKLNQLDVDTRSDVYGLGVLLYELLTGTTPLDKARLGTAALLEILRLVREEDPPPPSTRLSTADGRAGIAANRGSDPARLSRLVRGELDWIVMKALEKDRARRYETAAGLGKDVERYLKGDAVEACPPTIGYRLRKAYRRNRGWVTAGVVVAGILVAATAVSLWQAVRAGAAEDRARAELHRAADAENAAETALDSEKDARDEVERQLARVKQAEQETAGALRRSEGLRLATTALLRKPENHDQAIGLAHEAVLTSGDPATLGTALATIQGLPRPRPFPAATVPKAAGEGAVPFDPTDWVRYHPDGRQIFALDSSKRAVAVFDAATREPVRSFRLRPAGARGLTQLTLDPRGRWLLGYDEGGGLTLWDPNTGVEVGQAAFPGRGIWEAVFTTTGDRVALFGAAGDRSADIEIRPNRLVVYSVPGFTRIFEFDAPEEFRAAAFSPDGARLALSSAGMRTIRAWELGSKTRLLEAKAEDRLPWPALAFTPDGKYLVDAVREGLAVYDLATGKKDLVRHDGPSFANGAGLASSADGATLLVQPSHYRSDLSGWHLVGDPAPPRTFDLKQLAWGPVFRVEPTQIVSHSCLSADGRTAVGRVSPGRLVAWDTETGRPVFRADTPGDGGRSLIVSPDGRSAVTAGRRFSLRHWDLQDRGLVPAVEYPWSKEHALVTGDGRRVVVFRGDGRLETFDAATLRTLALGPPKPFPPVNTGSAAARVLADGARVLLLDDQKREAVLYTAAGQEVARYPGLADISLSSAARRRVLTPRVGGRRFLLPTPKGEAIEFRVYDAETGKEVCKLDAGPDVTGAWPFALTADGRRLAVTFVRTGGTDAEVTIWNLDAARREGAIPAHNAIPYAGQRFGAGDTRLVTWVGGRVGIWDATRGEKVREYSLTLYGITQAALSADGKRLATLTEAELAVWDADTGANVYRIPHPHKWSEGLAFVAGDAHVLTDTTREAPSTLHLFPTDVAGHFRALGLPRMSDGDWMEYGLPGQGGKRP